MLFLFSFWGCSSLLYHPRHQLFHDPAKLNLKPQDVEFSSDDGTLLHGWYFEGKQPSRGLIVFFHGNGENITSHYLTLLFVLEHGFDFFIFDYQGYGKSDGFASPSGTIADGKAALRRAYQIRPDLPLIVYGQSLGGAVAIRSVYEMKKELPIRLLIVDSTFSSYQDVARDVLAKGWLGWPFQWLPYIVLSDRYAPEDMIGEIHPIPLVVIHGTNDQIINYRFGERVFALAKDPKEFWTVEGGYHIDSLWRKEGNIKQKFLDKILSVSASP